MESYELFYLPEAKKIYVEDPVAKFGNLVIANENNYEKQWNNLENNYYMIIKSKTNIDSYKNSVYYGVIHTNNEIYNVWKKQTINTDPEIILCSYYNNKKYHIVRDDILIAGSYQRAWKMFENINQDMVYTGSHVCLLALSAKLLGKKVYIFFNQITNLLLRSRMYGAILIQVTANQETIQNTAKIYANKNNLYYVDKLEPDEYLYQQLKPKFNLYGRIWICSNLVNVLNKIMPLKYIFVKISKFQSNNYKTYICSEKYYDKPEIMPNYPSISYQDSKIWQFFIKHAKTDDIIWNSGSDNILPTEYYSETINNNDIQIVYNNFQTNQKILKKLELQSKHPEIKTIYKQWLITKNNNDFIKECENLQEDSELLLDCIYYKNNYIHVNKINVFKSQVVELNIGNYTKTLDLNKYEQFYKNKSSNIFILIMSMNYDSYFINTNKFTSLINFKAIEAFATPFNNNQTEFCSLFDIDREFGSLGNFFTNSFQNKSVIIENYPKHMLNKILDKCMEECEIAEKNNNTIRFFIISKFIENKYIVYNYHDFYVMQYGIETKNYRYVYLGQ